MVKIKKDVSKEQIQELDDIWHKYIFKLQKRNDSLWGDDLKDATTIEIGILNIISNYPDVILKDIKEMLDIPSSTLTNAVNRLERKGLFERVISKKDRRSFSFKLTDKGSEAQKKHLQAEKILWDRILGALDNYEERKMFLKFLKKITKNLSEEW